MPNRFHAKAIDETTRKYMGTLWNTYAFFILYAEIDQFNPKEHPLDKVELTLMDKWILSRLNSLIREVDGDLNEYKIFEASRAMTDFVDDLSNWYVRRSRERFWGKGMAGDKEAAFATLYHILETMSRLTAPFTPFMAESMYRNLVCSIDKDAPISVHMTDFPVCDERYINTELEQHMRDLLEVVVLGRSCRTQKERENVYPDAVANTLKELLPLLDNLQRALDPPCADENYLTGIKMIQTGFEEYLKKMGVETFGKAGEPFDPNLHNAVMHIEDESLGKNVVAQVFQSGYRRGDRILRHAMVQQAN